MNCKLFIIDNKLISSGILNLSLFFFNCCNFGNIPIRSCLWKAFDVENSPKISFSVDQANLMQFLNFRGVSYNLKILIFNFLGLFLKSIQFMFLWNISLQIRIINILFSYTNRLKFLAIQICQVPKNGDTILGIKKVSFSIDWFFS